MSNKLITINDTQIQQITYKDNPVVTIAMIAKVHGIAEKTVANSYLRNKERFIDGKHVYRLDYAEASSLPFKEGANSQGVTLFTQKGYALLTKPMRDQKSWEVQEQMIDEYFSLMEQAVSLPAFHNPQTKMLIETLMRIDTLEAEQSAQRDMIIATQAQTIAALEASQRAETKSDMAIDESRRFTLEEYVHMNGLIRQFPARFFPRYVAWLKTFCLQYGLRIDRAPTYGKPWDNELAYPIQALAAWLHYEQTKPRQIVLPSTQEE